MYKYTITGVVHPERADVIISKAAGKIGNEGELGEFSFSVFKSKIAGILTTAAPIPNNKTAALLAERSVRGITDTLGFTNGCGYDVEIIQIIDHQSNLHEVFGAEEHAIASLEIYKRLSPEKVADLLKSKYGIYLERSFSDLREALRAPLDSGFFCYRSIECLVHFFMYESQDSVLSKKEGWTRLRSELQVNRQDLDEIKGAADPLRHGNVKENISSSREAVLVKTWTVVEKYVNYALQRNA
jgi:hypothetical protein